MSAMDRLSLCAFLWWLLTVPPALLTGTAALRWFRRRYPGTAEGPGGRT
jgi:hypothetical protein